MGSKSVKKKMLLCVWNDYYFSCVLLLALNSYTSAVCSSFGEFYLSACACELSCVLCMCAAAA